MSNKSTVHRPRSPEQAELEEIRTTESLIHYFEQERCQKCGWVRDMVVPGCRCKTESLKHLIESEVTS